MILDYYTAVDERNTRAYSYTFSSYRLPYVVPSDVQSSAIQVTVVTPTGLYFELELAVQDHYRVSGYFIISPVMLMHPYF